MMKDLIIERISKLEENRKSEKRHLSSITVLDLKRDISALLISELESLIDEGIVIITGVTINKDILLSIKK